jgi:hypothetical protein
VIVNSLLLWTIHKTKKKKKVGDADDKQNTISWLVVYHLQNVATKGIIQSQNQGSQENTEWGPHAAKAICDQTREFPIPIGHGLTS